MAEEQANDFLTTLTTDMTSTEAIVIWDRSNLENYTICPFMARQVEEGALTATSASESGQAVHDVIAEAIKLRQQASYDEGDLADHMQSGILHVRPDIQPDAVAALEKYAWKLAGFLCRHANSEPRHPDDLLRYAGGEGDRTGQLGYEILAAVKGDPLLMQTGERSPVILTSECDLLIAGDSPEEVWLYDFKTGRQYWTATSAKESFQFGTFLPWLILKNYPKVENVLITIHMPRLFASTAPFVFNRSQLDAAEARLRTTVTAKLAWDEQDAKVLPYWPSLDKCDFCPTVRKCPMAKSLASAGIAESPESLLGTYVVLIGCVDSYKKALDKHVKEHGDIIVTNGAHALAYGQDAPKKPRYSASVYKPGEEQLAKE